VSWSTDLPEAAYILRVLIDAPSPNPPGDCEAVSRVCLDLLRDSGAKVRVVRSDDGTPSVLASLGLGPKRLLIHSHYDTQPAGDPSRWESDPYVAALRDGKIYGRGAGDDKGSVAAQLAALLALARRGFDPGYEVLFAFVADEESGGERGTRFLHERGEFRADAALIGEQTDNQVAIGERGIVWLRVTCTGTAAHGAIPEAGVSALAPAARMIDRINTELAISLRKRRPTPLLPASSVNVGRCLAGVDVSTVPSTAVVEIDRRIVPGETPEGCVQEIADMVDLVVTEHPGTSASIKTFLSGPAFLTAETDPLVRAMQLAVAQAGGTPRVTGYRQASDARFLANDGIPIVIFGPSDPEVGHAFNEHVAVSELKIATDAVIRLARSAYSAD
jgi:acetylornithine deacetylase/succinyl-diaminopimelate desuccinylase family protein